MKIPNYDKAIEEDILKYWEVNDIYKKVKEKNKGKKKYYFLQGPPYTSGRLHIGHAWNNSMKDMVLRYKRMKGFDVWDRAGYDMHGLPTENKIQQKLKLEKKEDIVKHGVDKFIKECIKWSSDNALQMDKDCERLGIWFDYESAYWPIRNKFMEGEWWLIKRAHEQQRLYKAPRSATWCSKCETGLAKHELLYETVTDKSIFVKLRVENKENEYLVIWTTTPWTIPFNLAVMVGPEIDYVRAQVEDEVWIVAKALAGPLITAVAGKQFNIIEELKGEKLEGIKYIHPFNEEVHHFREMKAEWLHKVLLSAEHVDTTSGSGLVHCAPGCGPEDQEVGMAHGLPAFNQLDERGIFVDMGPFTRHVAKIDDKKFIQALEDKGALIAATDVEHEYAHCWRCSNPIVYRTTPQWFMKVEDLRDKMVEENQDVHWVPARGKNQYDQWTSHLKDNSITRQRFWGTPVPIWECESCKNITVIGSRKELEDLAVNAIPEDLHKPWIDHVRLKCKCGEEIHRIPDVLDVWIDAGTLAWNSLDYPANQEDFKRLYPVDFVLEASEQFRLWFSMLNICSSVALGESCFKAAYMHGMILDYQGMKMSKSLGNIISPYEVVDKHGADVLRFHMMQTSAGVNINFSWDDVKNKQRALVVFWNVHKFMVDLTKSLDINPAKLDEAVIKKLHGNEEKYIISRLNSTIKNVTELFEAYRLDEVIAPVEELFLDLSRTYIQLVRDKAAVGERSEREVVAYTIYKVVFETLKMFSVISPFISEKMYLNVREVYKLDHESISFYDWPSFDEAEIDSELESAFSIAGNITQSILAARERAKINVRWPIKSVAVQSDDEKVKKALDRLSGSIKHQTNVKDLILAERVPGISEKVRLAFSTVKQDFEGKTAKIVAAFGQEKANIILDNLKKKGKHVLNVDGEKLDLLKEHFVVEREVPENLVAQDFRLGSVYLDKTRTKELDAEGYARELMRRVQIARKNAGLEKQDEITLYVNVDTELADMLAPYVKKIMEKVGAPHHFKIGTGLPAKKHEFIEKDKIKDKDIQLFFDKK